MQNVLAHGTPPRSGVVAGSLIRFLNILGRPTLRRQPRNDVNVIWPESVHVMMGK
jgi:hypothetical protein